MGLLDALSSGGGGGSLLDFLKSLQPQGLALSPDMQPANFNPQGYSPSVLNANAGPVPQNPPPVIQAQPVSQPQPQQESPGLGDRMLAGLQSFGHQGGIIQNLITNPLTALATGQATGPAAEAKQAQNLTLQYLINKGMDPITARAAVSNPEILKQVLAPQTVQSLGSGYIYNPRNGKVERAYEPEDKIPSGFAKDENGKMSFIPGGPADPAYQRLLAAQSADPNAVHVLGKGGELYKVDEKGNPTIVHKNESNVDASLDDATTAMMAKQYLAGDRTVMQNLGRGAQGSANIVKLRGAIKAEADAQGLDGNAIAQRMIDYVGDTARERTASTQEGRMSSAAIEAMGALKLARQASDAVPRTNWVPVNMAIQAYERNSGDPAIRAFGAANTTLINTYARAVNPNGIGTVADKEHAREMLQTADSIPAYAAVADQLEREINMAHRSPSQAREEFKKERENRLNGVAPPPAFQNSPAPASQGTVPKIGDLKMFKQGVGRWNGTTWEPAS